MLCVIRRVTLLLPLLSAWPCLAGKVETLVMPGPVIAGHAKYEQDCGNCHELFSKTAQERLCRDCHKQVAGDIARGEGFHGRIDNIDERPCKSCHTDHKGRDMDIVRLDRDTFAHDLTDYPLKGRHRAISCSACHADGRKFREAPGQCVDCHRDDDTHHGAMGKACADCHDEKSWRETGFDHAKTDYPLTGKHREVGCDACHPDRRYRDTPATCAACHQWNDPHRQRFGTRCDTCHQTDDWKKPDFDHDRETGFRLGGRHARAACGACHSGDLYKDKLDTACISCHKLEDRHQGRFGTRCNDCHVDRSWQAARFDHARETGFPLRGGHTAVACNACHAGTLHKDKTPTECHGCHRDDDVHRGEQGSDCAQCHNDKGWGEQVFFDHALTRFPLLGAHAVATCEDCHVSAAYRGTERACAGCHRDDDKHKGRLGAACGDCHNPNQWSAWSFDHDTRTDFRLDGAHRGLQCLACHKRPASDGIAAPQHCNGCHAADDIHHGAFGSQCDQCHDNEDFRHVDITR
jgi:hypothetical protein